MHFKPKNSFYLTTIKIKKNIAYYTIYMVVWESFVRTN